MRPAASASRRQRRGRSPRCSGPGGDRRSASAFGLPCQERMVPSSAGPTSTIRQPPSSPASAPADRSEGLSADGSADTLPETDARCSLPCRRAGPESPPAPPRNQARPLLDRPRKLQNGRSRLFSCKPCLMSRHRPPQALLERLWRQTDDRLPTRRDCGFPREGSPHAPPPLSAPRPRWKAPAFVPRPTDPHAYGSRPADRSLCVVEGRLEVIPKCEKACENSCAKKKHCVKIGRSFRL